MAEKPETQNTPVAAAPGLQSAHATSDPALDYVRQALAGLQFGQVAIIVQDGVVVQVERTERKRFRRSDRP